MVWKLLPTISAPMPLQMALDELLFESQKKEVQAPNLRFYVSSDPWISAGYSFRDSAALSKSDLILKNPQVPVCRRVTGGGCVFHGQDLIFSLIARYDWGQAAFQGKGACPPYQKGEGYGKGTGTFLEKQKWSQSPLSSVSTSYGKIHEGVKMGLELSGLDPEFYGPEDPMPKGSDCFDFPVESDLSWKGKKIAGGAQKRSDGVLLHHESISIPPGVKWEDLIRAIRKGLEQVFGVNILKVSMEPELYFQATRNSNGVSLRTK